MPEAEPSSAQILVIKVKTLIPISADRIKLDDLVSSTLRSTIGNLGSHAFPTTPGAGDAAEQFTERVRRYDDVIVDLQIIVILLAHWGESDHINLLSKVFSRLGGAERPLAGSTVWLSLACYPIVALMYAGGILRWRQAVTTCCAPAC